MASQPDKSRPDAGPDPFSRFLGGSPGAVILKLAFASLIVGALMALLGLSPRALVDGLMRLVRSVWSMGFEAIDQVGAWLIAGAVIVVPLWFVMRLISGRKG